jgi:hypothetical protein
VCWDALELLRGDSENFKVRGHHAVLSPVQLPSWASDDMVKEMLCRYEKRLVEQIKIMMSPTGAGGHSRGNSMQSNAGLSTDSSDETSSSTGAH